MRNWRITPHNQSVAKYIDCYWFLEKAENDTGHEYPKLNPDPAAHLIIANADQYYRYRHDTLSATGHGSHLVFPHYRTISMDHSRPFLIIGIKFHVGALYTLKIPAEQPLLDQVHSIDIKKLFQLSTFSANQFLDQGINEPKLCRDTLDGLLAPYFSTSSEDKHSRLVHKLLAVFPETPIASMGTKLGCSQRTIERSFLRVTGITLKQYHSMERLEAILNHLHKLDKKNVHWADLACQFGFSDQPHLIRYLKSSIGSTPGEYIKQRDLAIDVYGNFE